MAPHQAFTGFTTDELETLQKLLTDTDGQSLNAEFFKKIATRFNRSKTRVKKSLVKWTEVQNWFQEQHISEDENDNDGDEEDETDGDSDIFRLVREACLGNASSSADGEVQKILFEARSEADKAWYDVTAFLNHKNLDSKDAQVLVSFKGYKDDDEWVKVSTGVQQRSVGLDPSDCQLVEIGERALYYKNEGKAKPRRYFQVEILGIQRSDHNKRSCNCKFTILFIHDNSEDYDIKLKSLYFRPSILLDS